MAEELPVHNCLSVQEQTISNLAGTVTELKNKLSFVTVQEDPKAEVDAKEPERCGSPLMERLEKNNRQLSSLQRRLGSLLSRLEI